MTILNSLLIDQVLTKRAITHEQVNSVIFLPFKLWVSVKTHRNTCACAEITFQTMN